MGVKTILRYLLICGSLVLTVWLTFGLQINKRSIYSHLMSLRDKPATDLIGQIRSEFESRTQKKTEPKAKVTSKAKLDSKEKARKVQDLRVKKLKIAANKVKSAKPKPKKKSKPKKKTKVDSGISVEDEKALDDLLTARLDRLK